MGGSGHTERLTNSPATAFRIGSSVFESGRFHITVCNRPSPQPGEKYPPDSFAWPQVPWQSVGACMAAGLQCGVRSQSRRRGRRPTSMMPCGDRLRPGPVGLARRGAVAGVCVTLLAVGCTPGSHGRSGKSVVSPGVTPGGGGQPNSALSAAALARGHWSVLAASLLGSRQGPVLAWTGRELLELGGWGGNGGPVDGAAFDPADGRWRRIAPAPVPVGALAASVWTGSRLFVYGGQLRDGTTPGPAASLYDPASGRWSVTAPRRSATG